MVMKLKWNDTCRVLYTGWGSSLNITHVILFYFFFCHLKTEKDKMI